MQWLRGRRAQAPSRQTSGGSGPTRAAAGRQPTGIQWLNALRSWFWPVAVVWAFIEFRQPLHGVMAELPALVGSASKLSVGSVLVEVDRIARSRGQPEVATALRRLSPEAIRVLSRASGETVNQY